MIRVLVKTVSQWLLKGMIPPDPEAQGLPDKPDPDVVRTLAWLGILVVLLVLAAAVFVIWWYGPDLVVGGIHPLDSWEERALATLILLVMVSLYWGSRQALRSKSLLLEKSHTDELQADPILKEIKWQNLLLNSNLEALISKIGRGADPQNRLPWYLVLGAAQAGKTTLIENSGSCVLLNPSIKQTHPAGTSAADIQWRVADKAVLIEPPGTLAEVAGDDSSCADRLWADLIQWFGKTRHEKSLDGVIIVLSGPELLALSVSERRAAALFWRSRLREMMDGLGVRPPVYIVLNHMDRLTGFEETFQYVSSKMKNGPLGFNFSGKTVEHPEFMEQEFTERYNHLVSRLRANISRLLIRTRKKSDRESIFQFICQFSDGHGHILEFLQDAFARDEISTPPMVRGLYFTGNGHSLTAANALSKESGLSENPKPSEAGPKTAVSGTPYFISGLLSQRVFAEAGLTEINFNSLKLRRLARMRVSVLCLVLASVFVGVWASTFEAHNRALDDIESALSNFRGGDNADSQAGLAGYDWEALDEVRSVFDASMPISVVRPWHANLGLTQAYPLVDTLSQFYLVALEGHFLPVLLDDLMERLRSEPEGSDAQRELLYLIRMIIDNTGRDADWVYDRMASYWQESFPYEGILQNKLLAHLDFFLEHSNNHGSLTTEYRQLQARLQEDLVPFQQVFYREPFENRIVRDLIGRGDTGNQHLDLYHELGAEAALVFAIKPSGAERVKIPVNLTRQGLQSEVFSALENLSDSVMVEHWALGYNQSNKLSESDKKRLRRAVAQRYVSVYNQSWRDALESISLNRPATLSEAIQILEVLTGPGRPIERLVNTVAHNTHWQDPAMESAAETATAVASRKSITAGISRHFSGINRLLKVPEQGPAGIELVQDALHDMLVYLREIQDASNVRGEAYQRTRSHLERKSPDPFYKLQAVAQNAPEPISSFLDGLLESSQSIVFAQAISYMETQWKEQVITPFTQRIVGRYPFNASANREVSLTDFEAFFAPGGLLQAFHAEYIEPVTQKLAELTLPDGRRLKVSTEFSGRLRQAAGFREAFFDSSGGLDIVFYVEPLDLSANKRRAILAVEGQMIDYRHGAQSSTPVVWPNDLDGARESRITLVPNELNRSPRSFAARGPWSWFRLLEKGRLSMISDRDARVNFRLDGGNVLYKLTASKSRNPFIDNGLQNFSLPARIYGLR